MQKVKRQLLSILPHRLRAEASDMNLDCAQEIRLRVNACPEVILGGMRKQINLEISQDDINFVLNAASRYSPWTAAALSKGYLTAPGGHRIGVCGESVKMGSSVSGMKNISSICIRVAKDISGISPDPSCITDSFLIIGAPGWGKTTLLRDLTRNLAEQETVCVVDEREELFPDGFRRGKHMDVIRNCSKQVGIDMLIRNMSPSWVAVDEITEESDSIALAHAANCGVKLAATAHAASLQEFMNRPAYQKIRENQVFGQILVLSKNRTYSLKRLA